VLVFRDRGPLRSFFLETRDYVETLQDRVGLRVVPGEIHRLVDEPRNRIVICIVQRKLPPDAIGHKAIHRIPPGDVVRLVRAVLSETAKVFAFNRQHRGELEVGFDAQISNWAILGFDPASPAYPRESHLAYLDTSTPFLRRDGKERLDPELFLRSAPSFLVWILRLLFLQDVMTRYYDFRKVALDIAANFYKEQRADLVPKLVEAINDFFGRGCRRAALGG